MTFFKNPRFSAASGAITLTFFALFGALFLLTQYLQFVLGYDPLQTGIRLLPMAAVMMVAAPTAARIVERIGAKIVVSAGLLLIALGLGLTAQLTEGSSYWAIAGCLVLIALGMANTMAPATESIMGSLPREKAGVGSAVNDTTREVGGALGVAVLGSVLASHYTSNMNTFLHGKPVPPQAAKAVSEQVGAAVSLAKSLPGPTGDALAHAAKSAFVDGMGVSLLLAAGAAVLGSVLVMLFLPARAESAEEERAADLDAVLA
jgi:Na+/melibiose symporter-like transporter